MPTRIYQTWTMMYLTWTNLNVWMRNQLMNQLWSRQCPHHSAQYLAHAVRVPVRVLDNLNMCPVPSPCSPSPSPSPRQPEQPVPLPRKPARFGRRSAPVNVTQSMCLGGGLGLAAAISAADAFMDLFWQDWEVPSEHAGGESRRTKTSAKPMK